MYQRLATPLVFLRSFRAPPPRAMAQTVATYVIAASLLLLLYTYLGYPAILWLTGRVRAQGLPVEDPEEWPTVSLTVPAYNEESQIRDLLESLMAIDYPRDRLQLLIVSDASSDETDDVVREYADRGVDLLRMPERGGKTKAENAAAARLTGDIVINTDASIRILPDSVKALVRVFSDPTIGLASGRDISVGPDQESGNVGESGYVGYEMAIRDLETRVSGIIGASGCFYAIRPHLHRIPLPESLSRDFASALHTRENGFRPVSVPGAVCLVPRSTSLRKEYRRKVRTITRGMETLAHKRALLNPFRFGVFSWMLASHKICRWALPWGAVAALLALGVLAPTNAIAAALFSAGVLILVLASIGWKHADRPGLSKFLSIPAFAVAGNLAAMHALIRMLRGDQDALWEPTRRESITSA